MVYLQLLASRRRESTKHILKVDEGPAARCIGSCINGYFSSTWHALYILKGDKGRAARCIGSCINGYSSSTWPARVATLNNKQDWRH
ncbi:hypothetical protein Tco_0373325, partial [Tanacetum coccineum]